MSLYHFQLHYSVQSDTLFTIACRMKNVLSNHGLYKSELNGQQCAIPNSYKGVTNNIICSVKSIIYGSKLV